MTSAEFHAAVEQTWQQLEEILDEQGADIDCEIQGAVMTLIFPDRSQVVINKQEAMSELWLASKLGGYHFVYRDGQWVCSTDGRTFWQHLADASERHGEMIRA